MPYPTHSPKIVVGPYFVLHFFTAIFGLWEGYGTWDFKEFSHFQAYRSVDLSKDRQQFLGCGKGMPLGISGDFHTIRHTEV